MKKTLLTTLVTIVTISLAFSQTEDRKGYIGISIGGASPLGNFASVNPNNDKAGYATGGGVFDVTFAYRLGKHLGLTAVLHGQSNGYDSQTVVNQIGNANPGWQSQVDSHDGWSLGGIMGGIMGSWPMSEKGNFLIEPRVMAGFLSTTSPKLRADFTDGTDSGWLQYEDDDASVFAVMGGAGLRWNVSQKIGLLFNVDYLTTSTANYKNIEYTNSLGDSSIQTGEQKFESVNISVGVAFRLK